MSIYSVNQVDLELSSMLKHITIDVAHFDTETEETIAEIRKARDEQV